MVCDSVSMSIKTRLFTDQDRFFYGREDYSYGTPRDMTAYLQWPVWEGCLVAVIGRSVMLDDGTQRFFFLSGAL